MKAKYILILIVFGLILTAAPGCSLLRKRVEKTEKVSWNLSAVNKTKLTIDNTNGEIKITRTDDTLGIVTVEAEKKFKVRQDDMDKPIDNIKINIDTTSHEIKIETEIIRNNGIFKHNSGGEVNFNIKVPANISVDVDNTNGNITLTRIDKDIRVETVNASVNINRCSGNISIDGVNGGVYGNIDSTKGINIELVNGTVKLGGLKDISAEVNANTVHGKVKFNNLNFGDISSSRKELSGTLGKGGSIIRVSTVNGSITFDAQQVSYKKDDEFNFKIDFDDDGDLDIYERKNDDDESNDETRHGSQIDSNAKGKTQDSNKVQPDAKKIDSVKKK